MMAIPGRMWILTAITMLWLTAASDDNLDRTCHHILPQEETTLENKALNITLVHRVSPSLPYDYIYVVDEECKVQLVWGVGNYKVWPHRDNWNTPFEYKLNCSQTNTNSGAIIGENTRFLSPKYLQETWASKVPLDWITSQNGSKAYLLIEITNISAVFTSTLSCYVANEYQPIQFRFITFNIVLKGCPAGLYGQLCDLPCNCTNGGECHTFFGQCICQPGYTGDLCQTVSPEVRIDISSGSAILGGNMSFVCYLVPSLPFNISQQWLFNGQTTLPQNSDVFRNTTSAGLAYTTLVLDPITEEHQGEITCIMFLENGDHYQRTTNFTHIKCLDGFYGNQCRKMCQCPSGMICDWIEGCICPPGMSCDNESKLTIALAAGLSGMVLIIIVIGVAVFCLWQQRKKQRLASIINIGTEEYLAYRKEKLEENNFKRNEEVHLDPLQGFGKNDQGIEESLFLQWRIEEDKLTWGKLLGQGAFCQVYQGQLDWRHSLNVALKVIKDPNDEFARRDLLSEFQTLVELGGHPNIVQLFGITTCNGLEGIRRMSLVVEYMEHGSLLGILKNTRQVLTPGNSAENILPGITFLTFVTHVTSGMKYMASKKVIHRDLAARNILISSEFLAKIGDFGLSRDCYLNDLYTRRPDSGKKLPWFWMAPESMMDNVFTTQSDVWSFGILLWEICSLGRMPYTGIGSHQLLSYLQSGKRLTMPVMCPLEWKDIMNQCWTWSPENRPTFDNIDKYFKALLSEEQGIPRFSPGHQAIPGYKSMDASVAQDTSFSSDPHVDSGFESGTTEQHRKACLVGDIHADINKSSPPDSVMLGSLDSHYTEKVEDESHKNDSSGESIRTGIEHRGPSVTEKNDEIQGAYITMATDGRASDQALYPGDEGYILSNTMLPDKAETVPCVYDSINESVKNNISAAEFDINDTKDSTHNDSYLDQDCKDLSSEATTKYDLSVKDDNSETKEEINGKYEPDSYSGQDLQDTDLNVFNEVKHSNLFDDSNSRNVKSILSP